mmetsp:Transcript_20833/g.79932  ORF Transcript_20833/g.79932 Transcript_20833/m.79932 type:complete len:211 (-) Transcript_20833:2713-3345(-)
MDVGLDDAGTHAVDADALGDQLARQALGQRVDGTLGGGVVDIDAGRAELGGARAEVDDGPATAAVPDAHAQRGLLAAQQGADHVDIEQPPPARDVHRGQARGRRDDAGVVDQGRQWAQLGVDALEHAGHLAHVGHVRLHGDDAPAGRAQFVGERVCGGRVADVVEGQIPTGPRTAPGRRCADAARTAGDERDACHARHCPSGAARREALT